MRAHHQLHFFAFTSILVWTLLNTIHSFQATRIAARVRHDQIIVAFFSEDGEQDKQTFEDALVELESEALYGLGCKQSDLADFAGKLERGTLNLFPEYQRSYVSLVFGWLVIMFGLGEWLI
jgi:hypothetical protein